MKYQSAALALICSLSLLAGAAAAQTSPSATSDTAMMHHQEGGGNQALKKECQEMIRNGKAECKGNKSEHCTQLKQQVHAKCGQFMHQGSGGQHQGGGQDGQQRKGNNGGQSQNGGGGASGLGAE